MRLSARGFTLIELLIVVAILGVLASVVLINFIGPQKAARDTKRESAIRQYQTALEIFANSHGGLYPSRTTGSGTRASTTLCTDLSLSVCDEDPLYPSNSSYTYLYQSNGTNGGNVNADRYVLWARLEKTTDMFVACSNGKIGTRAIAGFSVSAGNCPI